LRLASAAAEVLNRMTFRSKAQRRVAKPDPSGVFTLEHELGPGSRGFYFEQIDRVFRYFPREQVRVIKFEEFRKRTPKVVKEVFRFLVVKPLAKSKTGNRI
jgi:hypothetical protein